MDAVLTWHVPPGITLFHKQYPRHQCWHREDQKMFLNKYIWACCPPDTDIHRTTGDTQHPENDKTEPTNFQFYGFLVPPCCLQTTRKCKFTILSWIKNPGCTPVLWVCLLYNVLMLSHTYLPSLWILNSVWLNCLPAFPLIQIAE